MKDLSVSQLHVLSALATKSMYGLEIIKHVEECGKKINIGSLYNLLNSLERNGLIEGYYGETSVERKGNRRRYYKITAIGESTLSGIQSSFYNNWNLSF